MKTSVLTASAFCTALTIILSQLIIPLGPVPISCSLLAVFLSGSLLPPFPAFLSQSAYLLLGFAGFPVFAGLSAGPGVLLGPTGGYLLAYPLMALIISFALKKQRSSSPVKKCLPLFFALFLCYLSGSLWLSVVSRISLSAAFSAGVLPFIPFDLIKGFLALWLSQRLQKAISL